MKPATTGQAGYTIIETMIFLIVSGVLVLSAIGLFSGRIQRTQFTQSVQALDARLKSIANEAATGTYPDSPAFNCTATSDGSGPSITASSDTQGTRSGCIFVGKVVNLQVNNVYSYTTVGLRTNPSGTLTSNLSEAKPKLVTNPDITQTFALDYGTAVTGIYKQSKSDANAVSGIAFFQSLNGNYGADNKLKSGAQSVETRLVKSSVISPVWPIATNDMAAAVAAQPPQMSDPLTSSNLLICLKSGNGDQVASITLGSNSGGLTTSVKIGDAQCQ